MVFLKSFRDQDWLLPPRIKDIIKKDNICFLVEKFVESTDFSEQEKRYEGMGRPAYHPRILCKIILMAMIDKERSSRRIANNTKLNAKYIYLAEKLTPEFRTICNFRKNNKKLLEDLFKLSVNIGRKIGSITLKQISIDGTKMKACASNKNVVTKEELELIDRYVSKEIEEGIKLDAIEDSKFGENLEYGHVPKYNNKKIESMIKKTMESIKKNPDNIKKIKKKFKKAKREIKEKNLKCVSLTDIDSRFMKNKKGNFELSYNPQIAMDNDSHMIVGNTVCQDAHDFFQLKPQIEEVEINCGKLDKDTKICVDNGYYSGSNIKYINDKNLDGYIPDKKLAQKHKGKKVSSETYDKTNFKYNEDEDYYTCPENKKLMFIGKNSNKDNIEKKYKGISCIGCKVSKLCTKSKDGIRVISVSPHWKEREIMIEKMKLDKSNRIYQKRKECEIPFAHIKYNLNINYFITKSKDSVENEHTLFCIAYNIKRLKKIMDEKRITLKSVMKSVKLLNKSVVKTRKLTLSLNFFKSDEFISENMLERDSSAAVC